MVDPIKRDIKHHVQLPENLIDERTKETLIELTDYMIEILWWKSCDSKVRYKPTTAGIFQEVRPRVLPELEKVLVSPTGSYSGYISLSVKSKNFHNFCNITQIFTHRFVNIGNVFSDFK